VLAVGRARGFHIGLLDMWTVPPTNWLLGLQSSWERALARLLQRLLRTARKVS
jgi:hypothetical protein